MSEQIIGNDRILSTKLLVKAIELMPKFKDAYQNRAEVYHSLGEEEKAAADEEAASKL